MQGNSDYMSTAWGSVGLGLYQGVWFFFQSQAELISWESDRSVFVMSVLEMVYSEFDGWRFASCLLLAAYSAVLEVV